MAKQELNAIAKTRTSETPTWFQQMAASGIIGALSGLSGFATGGGLTAAGAGLTGIAGTVGTARGLSTPTAQKFLAGQLGFQQAAQRGLQKEIPMTGMQAVDVIKAFPRAGVGMLTSE